jgi:hypothetical protein
MQNWKKEKLDFRIHTSRTPEVRFVPSAIVLCPLILQNGGWTRVDGWLISAPNALQVRVYSDQIAIEEKKGNHCHILAIEGISPPSQIPLCASEPLGMERNGNPKKSERSAVIWWNPFSWINIPILPFFKPGLLVSFYFELSWKYLISLMGN